MASKKSPKIPTDATVMASRLLTGITQMTQELERHRAYARRMRKKFEKALLEGRRIRLPGRNDPDNAGPYTPEEIAEIRTLLNDVENAGNPGI